MMVLEVALSNTRLNHWHFYNRLLYTNDSVYTINLKTPVYHTHGVRAKHQHAFPGNTQ